VFRAATVTAGQSDAPVTAGGRPRYRARRANSVAALSQQQQLNLILVVILPLGRHANRRRAHRANRCQVRQGRNPFKPWRRRLPFLRHWRRR
jgi:hypothetical protein